MLPAAKPAAPIVNANNTVREDSHDEDGPVVDPEAPTEEAFDVDDILLFQRRRDGLDRSLRAGALKDLLT